MRDHSEAFIGIDSSKLRNAIAIAEGGRGEEVRYVGEIDSAAAATTRKLVCKFAVKYRSLTFCYGAGPTGYGLYRLIRSLGCDCVVAAPSPEETRRSGEDEPSRRSPIGQAVACRRTHRSLGTRRTA